MADAKIVGAGVSRLDGLDKVLGRAASQIAELHDKIEQSFVPVI